MGMFKFSVKTTLVFVAVTGGAGGTFDTCDAVKTKPFRTRQATGKKRTGTLKAMMGGHLKTIGTTATLITGGTGAFAAANGAATGVTDGQDQGPAELRTPNSELRTPNSELAFMSLASELRERIADLRAVGGLGGGGGGAAAMNSPDWNNGPFGSKGDGNWMYHPGKKWDSPLGGYCESHDECNEGMTGESPHSNSGGMTSGPHCWGLLCMTKENEATFQRVFCCGAGFSNGEHEQGNWCKRRTCYQRCKSDSPRCNINGLYTLGDHDTLEKRPGGYQSWKDGLYKRATNSMTGGYHCCRDPGYGGVGGVWDYMPVIEDRFKPTVWE